MKSYERFISKEDLTKIHEASLKILSEVGVKFEHEEAIEIFKSHGAKVDGDIVYIGEELLEKALKSAPSSFEVYVGKNEEVFNFGKGSKVHMPVMGNIYIQKDGNIQKMTNEDTINQFKLSETSDFLNSNYLNYLPDISSFTQEQKTYYTIAMVLKYSSKPCAMLFPNLFDKPENESIRQVMIKGTKLIKRFFGVDKIVEIVGVNPISPLTFDHGPIERLLAACDENQAVWFTPCAMPLMTAPPSVAAMIAQNNSEVLAGLTLLQLIKPGTPVLYGNTSGSTDMRTLQLCIGTPETALVSYATAALADYYDLPFRTGGGLSDAKDFDIQAGLESMMMVSATQDCDPDLVMHCCGTMGSFNVVSFEKFIIDEEIWKYATRLYNGIDVNDKTLCFDVIKQTGPRGNYLKGKTPKLYRQEFILSKYLNKEDPNQWQSKGSVSLYDVLKEQVQKRIQSYQVPVLTKEQEEILKPYIPEIYSNKI